MGCLYCGKEIGPFRSLRDAEFCSSVHRKRYRERLGRALDQLVVEEPTPHRTADFRDLTAPFDRKGVPSATAWEFGYSEHKPELARRFPTSVDSLLGTTFRPLSKPPLATTSQGPAVPSTVLLHAPNTQVPVFAVQPAADAAAEAGSSDEPQFAPPAIVGWRAAAPAGRPSLREARPDVSPALPGEVAAARPLPPCGEWLAPLAAQAAERRVEARTRPASRTAPARRVPAALVTHLSGPAAVPERGGFEPALPVSAAEMWVSPVAARHRRFERRPEVQLPRQASRLAPSTGLAASAPVLCSEGVSTAAQPAEIPVVAKHYGSFRNTVCHPPVLRFAIEPVGVELVTAPPPLCEQFHEAPSSQPAGRWIEPAAAEAAYPHAVLCVALAFSGEPVESGLDVPPAPLCEEFRAAGSCETAERWIDMAQAGPLASRTAAHRSLAFRIDPASGDLAGTVPPLCTAFEALPAPGAAERWIEPSLCGPAAFALVPWHRPGFALAPATGATSATAPPPADHFREATRAEATERWVAVATAAPSVTANAGIAIRIAAGMAVPPIAIEEFAAVPAAEPAATAVRASSRTALVQSSAPRLLPLAVAYAAPVLDSAAPAPAATFAGVPPSEAVERLVPAAAASHVTRVQTALPPADAVTVSDVFVDRSEIFARPDPAEEAEVPVEAPAVLEFIRFATPPALPSIGFAAEGLQPTIGQRPRATAAPRPSENREFRHTPSSQAIPFPVKPMIDSDAEAPRAQLPLAAEVIPWPAPPAPQQAETAGDVQPVGTIAEHPPAFALDRRGARVPAGEIAQVEYFTECAIAHASPRLEWAIPALPSAALPFAMRPAKDKQEEPPVADDDSKRADLAEIFSMPEAKRYVSSAKLGWTGRIAAALMVGACLWFGARAVNFGQKQGRESQVADASPAPEASPRKLSAAPSAAPPKGMIARLRHAVAERARVEVGDTFHAGMASWGAGPKSMPAGWSRHPDGYVRPGDLALFQPTRDFGDYRLEFYGQIENKSMGWVMRAQDKNNYYAMKFTVVEPGLRPIVAMVHYPVIGGKRGRKVQTPLATMFHNNTPYHVTVEVKGNHFTASVEGEQVDSWTDDAAPKGGVGFFSEAGERARLYWTKVTKNQDWLGHICAFLAGDEAQRAAELWNPGFPGVPAPAAPRPSDIAAVSAPAMVRTRRGQAAAVPSRREANWAQEIPDKRSLGGETSFSERRNRWNS